jgi:hypothetical protein
MEGNKFESTEEDTSRSLTTPTRAVFDGAFFWYVSWEDKKPCLEVTSQWEDIDYRCVCVCVCE